MTRAHRSRARAVFLLLAVALGTGCDAAPDTFLVVRANADPDLLGRAARAVVRAEQGALLFDGTPRFPLVTLVTPASAASSLALEAELFDAGGASLGAVRATGPFTDGERRYVNLLFSSVCSTTTCAADESCIGTSDGASCETAAVTPWVSDDPRCGLRCEQDCYRGRWVCDERGVVECAETAPLRSSQVCRPLAGPCDVEDVCDGTSST